MDAKQLSDRQIATYLLIGKTDKDIHEVEVSVSVLKSTMDEIDKRHTHDKVCMYCGKVYGSFVAYNIKPGLASHGVCPVCEPIIMEELRGFLKGDKKWTMKKMV